MTLNYVSHYALPFWDFGLKVLNFADIKFREFHDFAKNREFKYQKNVLK